MYLGGDSIPARSHNNWAALLKSNMNSIGQRNKINSLASDYNMIGEFKTMIRTSLLGFANSYDVIVS